MEFGMLNSKKLWKVWLLKVEYHVIDLYPIQPRAETFYKFVILHYLPLHADT